MSQPSKFSKRVLEKRKQFFELPPGERQKLIAKAVDFLTNTQCSDYGMILGFAIEKQNQKSSWLKFDFGFKRIFSSTSSKIKALISASTIGGSIYIFTIIREWNYESFRNLAKTRFAQRLCLRCIGKNAGKRSSEYNPII